MAISTVEITDTDGLQASTQRVEEAIDALEEAGASRPRILSLISALQGRSAHLILARKALRDSEFYPYYPDGFSEESEMYDDLAQLVSVGLPGVPGCAECGHPEGEHGDDGCLLCALTTLSKLRAEHAYSRAEV